jgi:hypothetical protein
MPREPAIHYRSIRLYVNAGMAFPECYSNAPLLDLEKSALPTTGDINQVTCKKCIALHRKRYPWARQRTAP